MTDEPTQAPELLRCRVTVNTGGVPVGGIVHVDPNLPRMKAYLERKILVPEPQRGGPLEPLQHSA